MQFENTNLRRMVELLNDRKAAEEIVQRGELTYKLQKNQLKLITTSFIVDYFQKQQKSFRENSSQEPLRTMGSEENWHPNQLKIFTWVVLSYGYLQHKSLLQFTDQDIQAVALIFPSKTINFIRYHHTYLCKASVRQNRCEWREEEIALLTSIIQSNQFERKWSDIAYQLYCRSGLSYFKTSHQCREKWFNHLNPALSKEKWTTDEDIALFKNARDLGTKWAKISKAMGEYRTEHMIKNRFKSIAKKYENRYQRCTMRKRIENILKDLQLKKLSSKDRPVNENIETKMQLEESFETERKEAESLEIVKEEAVEAEVEPEAQVEVNPITSATEQSNHCQKQPQQTHHFNKICVTQFQAAEFEYAQEKYDFVYDEGMIVNLRQDPNHSDVTLIDYLHMDFQARNKTIFSGSVE